MISEQTRSRIRDLADYFDGLGRLELSAERIEALHQLSSEHPARRCFFISHRERVTHLRGALLGEGLNELAEYIRVAAQGAEDIIEGIASTCREAYEAEGSRLRFAYATPYEYAHESIMGEVTRLVETLRTVCDSTPTDEPAASHRPSGDERDQGTVESRSVSEVYKSAPNWINSTEISQITGDNAGTIKARLSERIRQMDHPDIESGELGYRKRPATS